MPKSEEEKKYESILKGVRYDEASHGLVLIGKEGSTTQVSEQDLKSALDYFIQNAKLTRLTKTDLERLWQAAAPYVLPLERTEGEVWEKGSSYLIELERALATKGIRVAQTEQGMGREVFLAEQRSSTGGKKRENKTFLLLQGIRVAIEQLGEKINFDDLKSLLNTLGMTLDGIREDTSAIRETTTKAVDELIKKLGHLEDGQKTQLENQTAIINLIQGLKENGINLELSDETKSIIENTASSLVAKMNEIGELIKSGKELDEETLRQVKLIAENTSLLASIKDTDEKLYNGFIGFVTNFTTYAKAAEEHFRRIEEGQEASGRTLQEVDKKLETLGTIAEISNKLLEQGKALPDTIKTAITETLSGLIHEEGEKIRKSIKEVGGTTKEIEERIRSLVDVVSGLKGDKQDFNFSDAFDGIIQALGGVQEDQTKQLANQTTIISLIQSLNENGVTINLSEDAKKIIGDTANSLVAKMDEIGELIKSGKELDEETLRQVKLIAENTSLLASIKDTDEKLYNGFMGFVTNFTTYAKDAEEHFRRIEEGQEASGRTLQDVDKKLETLGTIAEISNKLLEQGKSLPAEVKAIVEETSERFAGKLDELVAAIASSSEQQITTNELLQNLVTTVTALREELAGTRGGRTEDSTQAESQPTQEGPTQEDRHEQGGNPPPQSGNPQGSGAPPNPSAPDQSSKKEEDPAAAKKAAKERNKFWNTISNGFMFGVFFSALLCAFGLGILGMPLMMVSLLGAAVTKGIAYQGGFGLKKEDLENFTSDEDEKEKKKKFEKELGLTRKQIRQNKKFNKREKEIENDSEKISKKQKELEELEKQGLGSSKEAIKLKKEIAKLLAHKQGLERENAEFLDAATPTQLLALYRANPSNDKVFDAMIMNTFKQGLETTEKIDPVTGKKVKQTTLPDELKLILSEMTAEERALFMHELDNYANDQIKLIQAYQSRDGLVKKQKELERFTELSNKTTLTKEEQKELKQLKVKIGDHPEEYFTDEEKKKLENYEKIINDAHKITDAKRARFYNEIKADAQRTQDEKTLSNIRIIEQLKDKNPKTPEEQKLFEEATKFIRSKIQAKNTVEITETLEVSRSVSEEDIQLLRKTLVLMQKQAERIDSFHNARAELVALEESLEHVDAPNLNKMLREIGDLISINTTSQEERRTRVSEAQATVEQKKTELASLQQQQKELEEANKDILGWRSERATLDGEITAISEEIKKLGKKDPARKKELQKQLKEKEAARTQLEEKIKGVQTQLDAYDAESKKKQDQIDAVSKEQKDAEEAKTKAESELAELERKKTELDQQQLKLREQKEWNAPGVDLDKVDKALEKQIKNETDPAKKKELEEKRKRLALTREQKEWDAPGADLEKADKELEKKINKETDPAKKKELEEKRERLTQKRAELQERIQEQKEWESMTDEDLRSLDKNLEEKINNEADPAKKKALEEKRKRLRQKNKFVFKEEISDKDLEAGAIVEDVQWVVETSPEYEPTSSSSGSSSGSKNNGRKRKIENDKKKKKNPPGRTFSGGSFNRGN